MADLKISGLTALTAADTADLLEIVDVSDTTMAATGTNKKITAGQVLASGLPGSFSTLAASGLSTHSVTTGPIASFATTAVNSYGIVKIIGSSRGGEIDCYNGATLVGAAYCDASNTWHFAGTGADYAQFSSTGLAVTGSVSPTLNVIAATGKGVDFSAFNGVAAGTAANVLTDYDQYTAASAACTGAITTAAVWKLTKVGNKVTLNLPAVLGTASATTSFKFGTLMPAKYRPATNNILLAAFIAENNVGLSVPGRVQIDISDGSIAIWKDGAGTNFGVFANTGLAAPTAVSWTI